MKMILASASPRRKELLSLITEKFTIFPSCAEESYDPALPADLIAENISKNKVLDVIKSVKIDNDTIVIGCDTIVVLNNHLFGKPKDRRDAVNMLSLLSGKTHEVITGVSLADHLQIQSFHVTTEVTFYPLTKQEIEDYVNTGEPFDKAGAYGIQQKGSLLVEKIAGDYFNVVGLPVAALNKRLKLWNNPLNKETVKEIY